MRAKESRCNGLTPLCNCMDTARTLSDEDSFQLKTKSCNSKTKNSLRGLYYGLNFASLKCVCLSLSPGLRNVTVFEDKAFKEVIKVKWGL